MKKYIENIRVSVKKAGYTPTSDQIRQAINIICPDGVEILENKEAIINETIRLIKQSQESNIIGATPTDNNIQDSPFDNWTPFTTYVEETESSEVVVSKEEKQESNIIGTTPTDNNIEESSPVTDELTPPTIDVEETELSEIVVSEEEKQKLIITQSSVLDIDLSEAETVELCTRIPDVFDDYKAFVDSVTNAIKVFIDDKFDRQETQSVDDSISSLRRHIAARQKQLDNKFASGLNEVKGDLEQIRSNLKSRQAAILNRFKIPIG